MRRSATYPAHRGRLAGDRRTEAAPDAVARAARLRPSRMRSGGLTIIELSLVVATLAALVVVAFAGYQSSRERIRVAQAAFDIAAISAVVSNYALENRALPESLADIGEGARLDPWGRAYRYVNHDAKGSHGEWRRDKYIVPINSDFDVFSMGKDGASRPPLTAKASRDDVVRANNGRFVGLASDYDP